MKKVNNKYLSLINDYESYISRNIEKLNSLMVNSGIITIFNFIKQNKIYNRIFTENKKLEINFLEFLNWILNNKINFSEYEEKIGPELELNLEKTGEDILEKFKKDVKYYEYVVIKIPK